MELHRFFPYRLARLAETVSQATAQVYAERFALTRDEWRVLAALHVLGEARTPRVIEHTTLDKMRVSRALARMEHDGLVGRNPDPQDRRSDLVRLLPPGTALFRRIVPMVQAREAFLLDALDADERAVLDRALDKLQARAEQLRSHG